MKKILICILLGGILYISSAFAQIEWTPGDLATDNTPQAWWAQEVPPPENPYENDNWQTAWGEACDPKKDIMLNIHIPFVGRCIKKDVTAKQTADDPNNSTVGNVFPKLMWWMIRLVMTIIYIIGFLWILVGGFMIAASGADPSLKDKWKSLIIMIIGWLILLWASGVILNLINPNFFGTDS